MMKTHILCVEYCPKMFCIQWKKNQEKHLNGLTPEKPKLCYTYHLSSTDFRFSGLRWKLRLLHMYELLSHFFNKNELKMMQKRKQRQ